MHGKLHAQKRCGYVWMIKQAEFYLAPMVTAYDSSYNGITTYSCNCLAVYTLRPKQTWLNSNIRSNERTFECSLRNSNFAINSMRKCALISKVEKWHPHLKKWLQMLPVQVIWVNLCP